MPRFYSRNSRIKKNSILKFCTDCDRYIPIRYYNRHIHGPKHEQRQFDNMITLIYNHTYIP